MGESKRRRDAGGGTKPATPTGRAGRPTRAPRLTKRTIAWFLGGCLLLDVALWALFHFGFARCYGVLCLF